MIKVDLYQSIRQMYSVEWLSLRQIAANLGVSRNTVKKYCNGNNVPWDRAEASGRPNDILTAEVVAFIKNILEEDKSMPKKQRHTARRIFHRLCEEKGVVPWAYINSSEILAD